MLDNPALRPPKPQPACPVGQLFSRLACFRLAMPSNPHSKSRGTKKRVQSAPMNARIHDAVMKLRARAFPPPLQGSPRAGGLPRVPPSAPPWAKAPGAASRLKVFTILPVLSRKALASLCLVLLVASLAAPLEAGARKGRKLYNQARRAELAQDYDRALELYEQALNEHAGHQGYLLSVRRMQFVAAQAHVDRGQISRAQGELEQALEEFQRALEIDPASSVAVQERRRVLGMIEEREKFKDDPDGAGSAETLGLSPLERARRTREEKVSRLKGLPKLRPISTEPINLTIPKDQDSKVVFETVGKLAGINVLFDSEYEDEKVSLELQNVSLFQALDYVSLLAKAYWKPLTENAIFVTNDNSNKRRDYQEEVVQTFYLTNTATPQELQEVATAIRGLTDIRRVFAVPSMNALILRGPADKIALAEKVINDIDKARPEVIIDVLVLETSRTRNRELGITPVSGGGDGISLPVSFTGAGVGSGEGGSLPLSNLGKLSSRDWSTVLPGGQLTALLSSSDTRLLQSPRIRAADNFQASLRIGDRIPIATGSFQPGIGGVGINPLVNTQFTYTDVGVVLDLTPKIHNDSEISLHVEVEISTVRDFVDIGGISQPVIGQRRVTHDIRIKEGESSILGGLVQSQLFKTKSGVPFLGEIPILGRLFSSTDTQVSENEILVVLIPHIVRLPDIRGVNLQEVASGTEQIYRVRYELEPNDKPALPPVGEVGNGDEPTQRATAEPPTPAPGVIPSPAVPTPAAPAPETPPTPDPPTATPVQPAPTTPTQPATPTPAAPEPGAGARFRFDPAEAQVGIGEQVSVGIILEGVQQIFGVPMRFGWDPKVVRLAEIQKGTFLQGDGQDLIFSRNIRNDVGQAAINISRFPGTGGTDGGGLLVTLILEGVAGGSTTLKARATGARDATGQPAQVAAAELSVTVR